MEPRAITGYGIVSAMGIGREPFLRAMQTPTDLKDVPPRPVETFEAASYPEAASRVVEIPSFDPTKYLGDKGLRVLDRLTKLLVVAARLSMHDAGFKRDGAYVGITPERVGLVVSNAYGSLEAITELDRVAKLEDARYINPAKFPNTVSNSASGYVSIWEDLRAFNITVSDGNCGALDAFACADVHMETRRADAVLVGGGEALSEALYLAFHKLAAIDQVCCRLGEGAILFGMETVEHAQNRGARIRAELVGYGTCFVAQEGESGLIHASREAMERAVTSAIADAGVRPEDIDLVATGCSGVLAFDRREIDAITHVLGERAVLTAPKALLGETLGASGGMGLAAALAWMEGAPISSIIRPRGAGSGPINTVLVTSMGFYGNASAVVVRKPA